MERFTFLPDLPREYERKPILISGDDSQCLPFANYLIHYSAEEIRCVYEIKYAVQSGAFRSAMVYHDRLAVGQQCDFYLFDITAQRLLMHLHCGGYFGHLYLSDGNFFVATESYLYRLSMNGDICWKSAAIGIDGVVVTAFAQDKILGQGEMDPPGGWVPFTLDLATGKIL